MTSIPDELRTRRLVLRRVGPGDLDAAIAVIGDPETNLHNPAGPASPETVAAQLEEWQVHWARDETTSGTGRWYCPKPRRSSASAGCAPTSWTARRRSTCSTGSGPVTGVGVTPPRWHARPSSGLTEHAPTARWWIVTDLSNKPSQRVAEKLGFVNVGEREIEGPVLIYRRQEPMMVT